MPEALLFAGPSACGVDPALFAAAGVRLLPPVRRGDVDRIVRCQGEPGVLVVCDGVFQVAPAVSHAELCAALDAGWQVWGVSSLGAIRAHELRAEGMRGFGHVYEQFARFDDFTDDEMCLIHVPDPPYFPVTEALVNVRHALAQRGREDGIDAAAAQALVDGLRALWFGDRTPARIRELLVAAIGVAPARADRFLAWLRQNRVKTLDLERLLARRPWRDARPGAGTP